MKAMMRALILAALLVLLGGGLDAPQSAEHGPAVAHADFCSTCASPDAEE